MKDKVNTLIIGQGLAGTLLSFELLKRGQSVRVIDDGNPSAASRVAAGLISPITGQRTALMWRAAELLQSASKSYVELEALLGERLYFPTPLKRFYTDEEQRRRFRARMDEPAHAPWLGPEFEDKALGGIEIKSSAWLNVPALVAAWRKQLKENGLLIEAKANFQKLKLNPGLVTYDSVEAERVVVCLGIKESESRHFKFLRFQPTKGEILTIEADADESLIRYAEHFAIPLGDHRFRVGATYDRHNLTPDPTPEGLALLELSAKKLLGKNVQVKSHEAGIRPNLLGHFPVLGAHPDIPELNIINGFGSKGTLWAPYCAGVMADWILDGKEIPKELNVERFRPEVEF